MKTYKVLREETWTFEVEIQAKDEDHLMDILDDYDWILPDDAKLETNNYWYEATDE